MTPFRPKHAFPTWPPGLELAPTGFAASADGEIVVEVHLRDLEGKLLSDKAVGHIFRIDDERGSM